MTKKIFLIIAFCVTALHNIAQNRMTLELLWDLKRISNIQVSPDGRQILFSVKTYNLKENKGESNLFVMSVSGGEPKQITNFEGVKNNAQWRPDGKKIGFLKKGKGGLNIFEMSPDGSGIEQISYVKDGMNGFKYSPDGSKVLFIKEVKINTYHSAELNKDLPKSNALVYEDLMYRHWSEYEDGKYSHIFFAVIQNGKVQGNGTDIMPNEPYDVPLKPFGGMEEITWSPDGKSIIYTCKKMNGKQYAVSTNSDLYLYDLYKQKTINITKGMMGYDNKPAYSKKGDLLAWLSMEEDGYEADKNDIIILDIKTQRKKNLTKDIDLTVSDFVWDNEGKTIYFRAVIEATYQWFKIDIKNGKHKQITTGIHNLTSINFVGDKLIGGLQSMNHPTDIYAADIKTGELTQLTDVNKNIYDKLEIGKIEKRWVKTTDGFEELVWVIYPPNFDKNKKYPAILYCQGGPQSAVSQFFSYRWNFQLMAANDYIIIAPNRRGLPGFGQEWNDAISGDWGGQPIKDYLSAVDELKKEPFIDENRIGAVGASYGGYSVYYLAGVHENRFKCFISHCGLFNLNSWYGTTEELFFANHDVGVPPFYGEGEKIQALNQSSKKFDYVKNSPHQLVYKWNTPMLIFEGEKDYRVPYSQGLEAFQALQLKNIESKLVLFPDENHWVLSPQSGVFWHRQFYDWLDKYLK
ncbi:MAG TPA: S9 family peptidase [Crocinitomix sp.]|nr:S9 family peptidase [Crocinitomix sp.]